jgi:hypothetical protein
MNERQESDGAGDDVARQQWLASAEAEATGRAFKPAVSARQVDTVMASTNEIPTEEEADASATHKRKLRDEAAAADEQDRLKRGVKPLGGLGIAALGEVRHSNEASFRRRREKPPIAPPVQES